MADGFDFSDSDSFESVFTYSASQQSIPARSSAPAWQVVGAFKPKANVQGKLDFTGLVSVSGLILTIRLFRLAGADSEALPVTVSTGATVPVNIVSSGIATLQAGQFYQLQVQVVGGSDLESEFGIVSSLQLTI